MVRPNQLAVIALMLTAFGIGRAQEKDRAAEIMKLQEERAAILEKAAVDVLTQYDKGLASLLEACQMTRAAFLARLELQVTAKERIAVRDRLRQAMNRVLVKVEAHRAASSARQRDVDFAHGEYLTALIELRREELEARADADSQTELGKLLRQRSEIYDDLAPQLLNDYADGKVDFSACHYVLRASLDSGLALHAAAGERVAMLQKSQVFFKTAFEKSKKKVDSKQAWAAILAGEMELLREEIKQNDDAAKQARVKKLLEERIQTLDSAHADMLAGYFAQGTVDLTQAMQIQQDARAALTDRTDARVRTLKDFLALLNRVELMQQAPDHVVAAARAEVLAVRIELLRAEAKPPRDR